MLHIGRNIFTPGNHDKRMVGTFCRFEEGLIIAACVATDAHDKAFSAGYVGGLKEMRVYAERDEHKMATRDAEPYEILKLFRRKADNTSIARPEFLEKKQTYRMHSMAPYQR